MIEKPNCMASDIEGDNCKATRCNFEMILKGKIILYWLMNIFQDLVKQRFYHCLESS